MRSPRVVVVGAGIGGLAAALVLAADGFAVTVLDRAMGPGGKMRPLRIDGAVLDGGPTVFTMRWVFDEMLAALGTSLDRHLVLRPAATLARHAWSERERLDLLADPEAAADAIGRFAGAAEAAGYRRFCAQARRTYETLEGPFIRAGQPRLDALVAGLGLSGLGTLWRTNPFVSLWHALGDYFADPRLRQLFGRYATYCGASPFAAPATLMLVAHVEQAGVWLVEGGMHRVAQTLADLARERGAAFRYGAEVREIVVESGRVAGALLADGERIDADAVIVNADAAAVAAGLLGGAVTGAVAPAPAAARSLSAVTWTMVAEAAGFPLLRHTVFFSADYAREFDDLLAARRPSTAPTVYVCAQDRGDGDGDAPTGPERLLCLINAPATGDSQPFSPAEATICATRSFGLLERCGLTLRCRPEAMRVTTPADFARLYPGTGGALYGPAPHGWAASFRRPGARTRIPGLYLAGGSTHPGPGVPMAALSGRMAAASLRADLASTARSRMTVMRGGMSTH